MVTDVGNSLMALSVLMLILDDVRKECAPIALVQILQTVWKCKALW